MSVSHGILCDNEIVPGTERVLRDPLYWWPAGSKDTRSRQGSKVVLYVQHWTGGHITHDADAGPNTYAAMVARKRPDGTELDCAVNFVIGWQGTIWQCADVLTACVHVGDRAVIRRSVSTEHRWPGTASWMRRLGYDEPTRVVQIDGGRKLEVMLPSGPMLEASHWLAEKLASIQHPLVAIPRVVPRTNARMSVAEIRARTGAVEHGQVPSTQNKIDCAGLCNDNLAAHGWARG